MEFEKSMKWANKKQTICESIRDANDTLKELGLMCCSDCQCDDDWQKLNSQLVEIFKEIHNMAKGMTKRLYKYNKEWDAEFWEKNPEYEKNLRKRLGYE